MRFITLTLAAIPALATFALALPQDGGLGLSLSPADIAGFDAAESAFESALGGSAGVQSAIAAITGGPFGAAVESIFGSGALDADLAQLPTALVTTAEAAISQAAWDIDDIASLVAGPTGTDQDNALAAAQSDLANQVQTALDAIISAAPAIETQFATQLAELESLLPPGAESAADAAFSAFESVEAAAATVTPAPGRRQKRTITRW